MKKAWILIIGILMAGIIAGCSSGNDSETVTFVKPAKVLEQVENGETFAFVIGDEDCSACQAYKADALKKMSEKDNIKLGFIEIKGIEDREDDLENLTHLIDEHLQGQFEATPTTYYMVDGELASIDVGTVSYEELKAKYSELIEGEDNDDDSENSESEENEENNEEDNNEENNEE